MAVAAALALILVEGTAAATYSVQPLTAEPVGSAGDRFGYSVALDGNFAVVGAPGVTNGRGAAYVYWNPGNGHFRYVQTLTPPNGAPSNLISFGISVSIWGGRIAVGSLTQQLEVGVDNGAVYVFTLTPPITWGPPQTLTAGDFNDTTVNAFGASVSIGNTALVVGAPFLGGEAIGGKGAAFTYSLNSSNPPQFVPDAKLTPPPLESMAGDHFGAAVAIFTGNPLVGAPGSGYAYLMPLMGGAPIVEAVSPAMGGPTDLFGQSVAMGRVSSAVAAPGIASAYAFSSPPLTAFPSSGDPNFGASVAQSGFTVVGSDPPPGAAAAPGAAYVFNGIGLPPTTLASLQSAAGDHFGFSTSLGRSSGFQSILVGAYGQNNSTGAAFVFTPPPPAPALGRGGALALAAALAALGAFSLRLRRRGARA